MGNWWKTLCWSPTCWWKTWCSWQFVYLGDCICPGGDCALATIKGCRSAWGKFRELLPLHNCKVISLSTRGHMYDSCVRGTMVYSSECWALKQDEKKCLEHSETEMVVQHQERACQHKFLLSWLKNLNSVLRYNWVCGSDMGSKLNCILDSFWPWKWKEPEVMATQRCVG